MSCQRPLPIPPIPYTSEFKRRVLRFFPPSHQIHRLVNEGSLEVGEYLTRIKEGNWYCTVEEVVQAINGSDTDRAKLQKRAHKRAELYELYREWKLAHLEFLRRFPEQTEHTDKHGCSSPESTDNPRF